MKQILFITLFSFVFSSFMIASTDKFTDTMAVIGSPVLSSDPCAVLDKKLIRLDAFRDMVNNTSAFHLEEKAEALAVPGITVSNNKNKMLRDAKRKYSEYSAERQKYGCDTSMTTNTDKKAVVSQSVVSPEPSPAVDNKPVKEDKYTSKVNNTSSDTFTDTIAVIGSPGLSSDPCAVLDKKLIRLDAFRDMVNNTSAFHLEEKAEALAVPGITVSNNKNKMLRDAKRKYSEYSAERQKYGCDTPMIKNTDKKAVVSQSVVSPEPSPAVDNKPVKQEKVITKVNNTSTVYIEEKSEAQPKPEITVSKKKEPTPKVVEKKPETMEAEHPKDVTESTAPVPVVQAAEKKTVPSKPVLSTTSSDECAAIDKKLIKLYEFMIMLDNTSAFHLEEKAEALAVPGITVSNNKKKMLRDAKKKYIEYTAERQTYGCKTSE